MTCCVVAAVASDAALDAAEPQRAGAGEDEQDQEGGEEQADAALEQRHVTGRPARWRSCVVGAGATAWVWVCVCWTGAALLRRGAPLASWLPAARSVGPARRSWPAPRRGAPAARRRRGRRPSSRCVAAARVGRASPGGVVAVAAVVGAFGRWIPRAAAAPLALRASRYVHAPRRRQDHPERLRRVADPLARVELRRSSARSVAFWRSSVSRALTARPMPAFSLSSETCMKTMPMSAEREERDPHAAAEQAVEERRVDDAPGRRARGAARAAGRPRRRRRREARVPRAARGRGRRRAAAGAGPGGAASGGLAARRWRSRMASCGRGPRASVRRAAGRTGRAGWRRPRRASGRPSAASSSSASGSRPQAHTGRSGGQMHPCARSARKRFTRRSSSEWKEIPANRPTRAQQLPRARQRGVELAELVVDRDADRLERRAWPGGRRRSAPAPGSRRR